MRQPTPLIPLLPLALMVSAVPLVLGACSEQARVEAAGVTKEAGELWAEIKKYSVLQKDKFQVALGERMQDADQRLSVLRAKAGEELATKLVELERKRTALRGRLDELGDQGSEAWGEVRDGLVRSYEELSESIERAAAEFE